MHKEILSREQFALLNLVKLFSGDFGLVGGTAIALHLGHRESIDYDLFTFDEFINQKIRKKIVQVAKIDVVLRDETGQFTLDINGVRFTWTTNEPADHNIKYGITSGSYNSHPNTKSAGSGTSASVKL